MTAGKVKSVLFMCKISSLSPEGLNTCRHATGVGVELQYGETELQESTLIESTNHLVKSIRIVDINMI